MYTRAGSCRIPHSSMSPTLQPVDDAEQRGLVLHGGRRVTVPTASADHLDVLQFLEHAGRPGRPPGSRTPQPPCFPLHPPTITSRSRDGPTSRERPDHPNRVGIGTRAHVRPLLPGGSLGAPGTSGAWCPPLNRENRRYVTRCRAGSVCGGAAALADHSTMDVELLVVPDCPNETAAVQLLSTALADLGLPDTGFQVTMVTSESQVAQRGFTGSPTFLIDGIYLFRPTRTTDRDELPDLPPRRHHQGRSRTRRAAGSAPSGGRIRVRNPRRSVP